VRGKAYGSIAAGVEKSSQPVLSKDCARAGFGILTKFNPDEGSVVTSSGIGSTTRAERSSTKDNTQEFYAS